MSSQNTFFKIIFSVVALVLMLHICFSLISTSPVEAAEAAQEQSQIQALNQQIEALTQLVEQLSDQTEHILVLEIRQECLNGAITLETIILQVTVDKSFFDSCQIGDDITDSNRIRLLSSSILAQTRVTVKDKFTISR